MLALFGQQFGPLLNSAVALDDVAGGATATVANPAGTYFPPAYNAVNFDSRRCAECGKVFALRTKREVETSRRCESCQKRFYSRESQRRRRSAPDLVGRVRGREQGDAAVAAAERRMAQDNPWAEEEYAVWRLDMLRAQERENAQSTSMEVKGEKYKRNKNK